MKLAALMLSTALIVTTAPLNSATAQDKSAGKKSEQPGGADMAEMMKKWEAVAAPGPAHKLLEPLVGEWNVAVKMWMAPGAPPMESKGTTRTHWIMGGRFLQDDYSGEFMGKPMKGLGISGYDNLKKKYTSFWIDEGGTGMYTSEGTASADGKMFTYHGKMDDPMTGEKDKPMKFVVRILSSDKHVFEMHDETKGEKSLCGELTYTKK
jgi:hypothetical protein